MTMNLKKVFISSNHRLYVVPTFWWVFFYPHIRIVELSYYSTKNRMKAANPNFHTFL